jgi:hypothetical protein
MMEEINGRSKMTHFHFWKHSEVKKVPEPVLQYMRRRFMLPALYMAGLKCVEYEEILHDKPVVRICIFDPYLASSTGFTVRKYQDLEEHPELLLFEGYIDRRGVVYVADRRSSKRRRDKSDAIPSSNSNGDGSINVNALPKAKLASYGPGAGWQSHLGEGEEL